MSSVMEICSEANIRLVERRKAQCERERLYSRDGFFLAIPLCSQA